jgi:hypothetical protein
LCQGFRCFCGLSLKFCSLDFPFRFTVFRFEGFFVRIWLQNWLCGGCWTVGTEGEDAGLVVSLSEAAAVADRRTRTSRAISRQVRSSVLLDSPPVVARVTQCRLSAAEKADHSRFNAHSQSLGSAGDAAGNFAAVGNEDGVEHCELIKGADDRRLAHCVRGAAPVPALTEDGVS